jgi:hypothetical protein
VCIYLVCATSKKEKQMRQLNEIQDVGLVTLQTLETLELETRLRLYQESCTLFSKFGSNFNVYKIFLSLPRQACLVPCTTTERKDVEKYADGIL